MAKDPAFLFYPNDYIGGTMGMTFEEKGAYIDLLMTQFNRGHMTDHMIGQIVGQLWVNIKVKFRQDQKGLWYNERLDEEKIKRQNYTKSRNNNLSGKNQYPKKPNKNSGHMTYHMENENVNENIDVSEVEIYPAFSDFWDLYDKKTGKDKCESKWDKLNQKTKELIIDRLPNYVNSTPNKEFRKNPLTWLNGKHWDDEIILKQQAQSNDAMDLLIIDEMKKNG